MLLLAVKLKSYLSTLAVEWKFRISLFSRLLIIISIILVVILGLAGHYFISLQEKLMIRNEKVNAGIIADLAVKAVSRYGFSDVSQVSAAVADLQNESDDGLKIVSVELVENNGKRTMYPVQTGTDGNDYARFFIQREIPTVTESKNVTPGAIQVHFSLKHLNEKIQKLRMIYGEAGLIIIVLIDLTLIVYIYRVILRPLRGIARKAEMIAKGEFGIKNDYYSNDEIGYLSDAFYKMSKDLQLSFKELQLKRMEIEEYNLHLQEKVDERTADLLKAERMASLGGMVAGIAHEINTPVGIGVTAATHLYDITRDIEAESSRNELTAEKFTSFLHSALESTDLLSKNLKRASNLIQSFKQVAADQASEQLREFNLAEYVGEIILSLHPRLKRTRHRVDVRCREDLVIKSYPGLFSQIITNLLINSLEHAYDVNDAGHIGIDFSELDDILIFSYSDDGKGISENIRDRVFEPFFTTRRNEGGTGLGLSIVYSIVTQKLGGRIDFISMENHGTTFLITIPKVLIKKYKT